jgi:hypothetical protein
MQGFLERALIHKIKDLSSNKVEYEELYMRMKKLADLTQNT